MRDRGEITLALAVVAGVLIPAVAIAYWLDSTAGATITMAAALVAARTIWRQLVRPVARAAKIVLDLPDRLDALEERFAAIESRIVN